MKILVAGGTGQLGRALAATIPDGVEIISHGSHTLDITDRATVERVVAAASPSYLINAAAYTAVDQAETEEAVAMAINGTAVGILASAAHAVGAAFVHISTDFVFDGHAGNPYMPEEIPNPLSVYGRTKLAGERLAGPDALTIRTAWVYGPTGRNFVRTMLKLMAERTEVRVVADQVGSPTYAPSLATAIWKLALKNARGMHHYTDAGVASWYDFAVAIQEEALAAGVLDRPVPIVPIATADYPTPARRPAYSVLDKTATFAALGAPSPHWRVNLRAMIREIKANG